jgi:hypothetical protein
MSKHPYIGQIRCIRFTQQWVKVISVEGNVAQVRQDFGDATWPVSVTELMDEESE